MSGTPAGDFLITEDGLPRPRWDGIRGWIAAREPADRPEAWVAIVREWLAALGAALGGGYEIAESRHFVVLAPTGEAGGGVLRCAESSRTALRAMLGDLARFDDLRKEVVIVLRTLGEYYRYISFHDAEGEQGPSVGVHIREGLAHVALHQRQIALLEETLSHELTHVALHHLSMPQWIEEGLAQIIQRRVAVTGPLQVDEPTALRHKRHWSAHGLEAFWSGAGFSAPGEVQRLCYELAEILVRLLVKDARPHMLGGSREPQRRFLAFLRAAGAEDAGQAACLDHLGFGIEDLAARFLGPPEGDRAA